MKKLSILITLLIPVFTFSQIINIPADYPSIQQGIDNAEDGTTILVEPGIYTENINFSGKEIIVASQFLLTQDTSYITNTIIDGNQNGVSVVHFENGESQSTYLIGFTITNGHSNSSGGGISCVYGSNPQLENLIIKGNSAQYNGGGMICGAMASPGLKDVVISKNSAGVDGGGIFCFNFCSPFLENVTITGNSSGYHGGGICCLQNSSPSLTAVTFTDNSSDDGGGIFCANNSNPELSQVYLLNNSATDGGGIYMVECSPTFSQVTITGNTATRGGGIYCADQSELDLSESTINNNLATDKGAGVYVFNAGLYVNDCSFTENEILGGQGGAIYFSCGGEPVYLPEVVIKNSTISNNRGTDDGTNLGSSSGAAFLKPEEFPPFDIQIENCTFEGNRSKSNTALRITGSELGFSILNCTFLSNEASQYTAAAAFTNGCSGDVINCLFASNTANTSGEEWNSGGASLWNNVDASFVNCTFADNSAFFGSAITLFSSEALLLNSIIWENGDNQITLLDGEETGSSLIVGYSDVQNGEGGIEVGELSEVLWEEGNGDENPIFVESGEHPYQINDNSTCIQSGTVDTSGLNLPEYDLAGEIRIFNDRIDMGAYEWSTFVGEDAFEVESSKLKVNCYPNPITTTTTLSYDLPQPSAVQITIVNHLGQQVDFIQQNQLSGKQQVGWDAKDLPSGIYFVQVQTAAGTATTKLIKRE